MTEFQSESKTYSTSQRYPWFSSRWMKLFVVFTTFIIFLTSIITEAPILYPFGQLALLASVVFSLSLLADRPLLNPLQALVAVFYWWFGVAPLLISTFKLFFNSTDSALLIQMKSIDGVWPVAFGLPLYAFYARSATNWLEKQNLFCKPLLPQGKMYKDKTILVFFSICYISFFLLTVVKQLGFSGIEEVNYLGGTKTTIWWVGIIGAMTALSKLLNSALLYSLVVSRQEVSRLQKVLAILVIIQSLYIAAVGGWKGGFVLIVLYSLFAYISETQKIPFKTIIIGLLTFVVLIEPYVKYGRYLSEISNITSSAERKEIFTSIIASKEKVLTINPKDINIESPFRGLFSLASSIVQENDLLYGAWNGKTIIMGLSALVPRVIYPGKPDLNVGNFFYHNLRQHDFETVKTDDQTNISLTIPFEVIGNFGIIAGIASFAVIGVFWGLFSGYLLSPQRLANHPLTPLLVGLTFNYEMALGHFLASLRSYVFPLLVIFIVWKACKREL